MTPRRLRCSRRARHQNGPGRVGAEHHPAAPLAKSPTAHSTASRRTFAQRQSRTADSLHHLEEGVPLADPSETLSLSWLRTELMTIIERLARSRTTSSARRAPMRSRDDGLGPRRGASSTARTADRRHHRHALLTLVETDEAWRQLSPSSSATEDGANLHDGLGGPSSRGRVAERSTSGSRLSSSTRRTRPAHAKGTGAHHPSAAPPGRKLLADIVNRKCTCAGTT